MKAVFLTHEKALKSEVTGGVQLCSQEFHRIIMQISKIQLDDYYVPFTRRIIQRAIIRWGLENYSMFNVKKDAPALLQYLEENAAEVVFINMASAVRFAKPIREKFGKKIKIVLLSHGNHSGDFLHLITKPIKKESTFLKLIKKIRLGLLVSTESEYRVKYLDAVITLSDTEKQIENWFGAKKTVFLPRRIYADFLDYTPVRGRIGFVGRLDHPPNLQGMQILLDAFFEQGITDAEIRLVGAPEKFGKLLQSMYPIINYIGELSDADLEKEVADWAVLLNPVWWYSTGASTKLAKAISWGIPIITTTAGMRGYNWKDGNLLVADSPAAMAILAYKTAVDPAQTQYWANQTRYVASNGLTDSELSVLIENALKD